MNEAPQLIESTGDVWPFGVGELTAALRRHLHQPALIVRSIRESSPQFGRPTVNRVRGVCTTLANAGQDDPFEREFVLKEPRGATRKGLAGVGRREAGFYRYLADEVPMRVPQLIASHPLGRWFLFDMINASYAQADWGADDFRHAAHSLARLHDRYWGLGEDLAVHNWLGRPLDADFAVHMSAAATAFEAFVRAQQLTGLTDDMDRLTKLGEMLTRADRIAAHLQTLPATLVHGGYNPRIIGLLDGQQLVGDWQRVSIAPPILDVATFVTDSQWLFDNGLPIAPTQLVADYRLRLAHFTGIIVSDEDWQTHWDYALMWIFLHNWVELLAQMPVPLWLMRRPLLETVLLMPVLQAAERQLSL